MMAMKRSVWDMILKVVIAVASAVAGDESVREVINGNSLSWEYARYFIGQGVS